ncbi:hypothetical protein MMG36_002138 [Salmonella enterica subsp. enterica serovar Newport]|uniref:Uncharacterized protein n=1 Tax=Salmonella typhimurium (strain SL1344) TaxID=216597 RepID=A0A718V964_SALTS|nr:hypothetical protein [Salmonella enterica]EBG6786624.1 hypothetical protein [Salmonella enterica subsp. enterica]EBX0572447.1 hypothetical protein [Salmonella enterica subsp. enterica serovar Utah]EBZ2217302.1 hypothetical protein [Salmonella enterica subsp. enterica serovar Montevideo]ECD4584660.1 hypothetical protein [Salmonella enterica subsp. enterica serovar Newport]EEC4933356.1 hypothetical protein [Salmonella enterica subsp. enterica serovar Kasenyi]HAD6861417.1 hypothetical protein
MKVQNITDADLMAATLISSGISEQKVNDFLNNVVYQRYEQAREDLISEKRAIIAESLSYAWIIEELRRIIAGQDKVAAVAALDVLQRMSKELFNTEFLFK